MHPAFHASRSRTGQPRESLVPSSRLWVSSGGESWRPTLPRGTRLVFKTPGQAALRPAPSSPPPPPGWASEPLVQRSKRALGTADHTACDASSVFSISGWFLCVVAHVGHCVFSLNRREEQFEEELGTWGRVDVHSVVPWLLPSRSERTRSPSSVRPLARPSPCPG